MMDKIFLIALGISLIIPFCAACECACDCYSEWEGMSFDDSSYESCPDNLDSEHPTEYKEDVSREDVSREDVSREDVSREDVSREEISEVEVVNEPVYSQDQYVEQATDGYNSSIQEKTANNTEVVVLNQTNTSSNIQSNKSYETNSSFATDYQLKSSAEVYLVPYVGDFDGNIDSDWYYFYDKIWKWHSENNVKVGISFYPSSLDNEEFAGMLREMAKSPNVELIIKSEPEHHGKKLADMDKEEAKAAISHLQDACRQKLGFEPTTYNQEFAEFTPSIRDAIKDLGFKFYFEHYVSDYGYVDMLPDFDITQYSVTVTENGGAGPENSFNSVDEIYSEILSYDHEKMLYIDGKKVIPLLVHQQDFRVSDDSDEMDDSKWRIYTEILKKASNDPRVNILLPKEVYQMRHR